MTPTHVTHTETASSRAPLVLVSLILIAAITNPHPALAGKLRSRLSQGR